MNYCIKEEPQIKLPKLISRGMVLQRGEFTRIWGWTKPETRVIVELQDIKREGIVQEDGQWQVKFEKLETGGPFTLKITANEEIIIIEEVYVGDVWLCSGQSNMELPISRVKDRFKEVLKGCSNPQIRMFKIQEDYTFEKPLRTHSKGEWKVCNGKNILDFSALAYFFADYIHQEVDVPIGVIDASLGGSPIEAWLPEDQIVQFPRFKSLLEYYRDNMFVTKRLNENEKNQREWCEALNRKDQGIGELPWYNEQIEDEEWEEMKVPGFFKEAGLPEFVGSVWLRKKFYVTDKMLEEKVSLWLGTIVDRDETYINGQFVGRTDYQYPPRKYEIPDGILHKGENTIAIRVICNHGKGRMTPGKAYKIFTENEMVDLTGIWKYKVGTVSTPTPEVDFVKWKPTGLYNAMLAPCHLYTIKGAIWYQGESNAGTVEPYDVLLEKLITCWRKKWGQGDFPFLIVQLPNFEIDMPEQGSGWPELREAQQKVECLSNTGVAVTIDLGEANDLHPLDKKSIAYRLSLAARVLAYGENINWQGPKLKGIKKVRNEVTLEFSNVDKKLVTKEGCFSEEFELAGEDGVFYQTTAHIQENQVHLKNKQVNNPIYIRYAYSDNPHRGLLYNTDGLPMGPFQIKIADE